MNTEGRSGQQFSLPQCLENLELKEYPFSEKVPSPKEFWFGPDDYLVKIGWYVDNIIHLEKANLLLLGDYGTGKSFALKRIQYLAQNEMPNVIPVYLKMERPERGFRSLYQFFMDAIGKDELLSSINRIKENSECRSKKEFIDFLRNFLVNDAVCKALAIIAFDEDKDIAFSWILGTGGYWEARKIDVDIYSANSKHALNMMTDVIRLLTHDGKAIAILIDEMENLVGASRRVEEVREGLRDLYDEIIYGDIGKVLLITACTAETYYRLSEYLGEAFRDRIDEEIMIRPMNEEAARSYLKELLAWAKHISLEQADFKPFENELAVDNFLKISAVYKDPLRPAKGLTRRKIIKMGTVILRVTCQKGSSVITNEILDEIIQEKATKP